MAWNSILSLSFLILLSLKSTSGYYVVVDAHTDECFFEKITAGTRVLLTFEVIEGGFLDIDVKITGPDHKEVFRGDKESGGKTTFSAHIDGTYTLCFSNRMSTMTPKTIMFTIDLGDTPKLDVSTDGTGANVTSHHNKLEELVAELSTTLMNVKHEQEFMEVRERIHRAINENTNSRVVMWSCFEAFILLAMAFGQVYYLKRFFEVRRVV
ncbi:unnamed protein product [Adineta steineri]|uniref:GOLD domain-containing protein n=1 Tax=Adineta steineri TaxID=433720 RepID=A0A815VY24_9BILA|nr:unnamed protein product [Adineta steineri]CAF1656334.1 unnamed protein product [Adineta steineri]